MDEKYIGRICPYCKQPIGEEDEIVVCERCLTAMHKECREKAGKCAAIGCEGADAAPSEKTERINAEKTEDAAKAADAEKTNDSAQAGEPVGPAAATRKPEDIYRNPSFCPSCGAAVPPGADNCPSCGFHFASHPAAKQPKKKVGKKGLVALIVCLVVAVAALGIVIGGISWYREETADLRDELYDCYWVCPELNEQVQEGDLFVSDTYVIFEGQSMRMVTSNLLFGGQTLFSAQFTVNSPWSVTLLLTNGQQVSFTVEYREDGPYDRMIWTGESGNVLNFNEVEESGSYYN